ncbi:hypothetical protein GCM10010521_37970 [Streptomyces rameus]|uniref:Resolvase/invertase-type recombinase catalytic domain-containing protein n=1 Tax=Streptomyces rameus TaxID=68261 RepID=A0ABP6NI80_9ACTN
MRGRQHADRAQPGIYPQGAGKVLCVVFAAMAEVEREFIHERTLIGLDTAAANGNQDSGPPPAVDAECSPSPCAAATPRSPSPPSPSTLESATPPFTGP